MKRIWRSTLVIGVLLAPMVRAEYGDVLLNRYAEANGERPVVFSHWFHRARVSCKVCHSELGFAMKVGRNDVTMGDIVQGQFCGMCHNGDLAWSTERCQLCHTGKAGNPTRIFGGHKTAGPSLW